MMWSIQFTFVVIFLVTGSFAGIQNRIAHGEIAKVKQIPYVARIDLVSEFPPGMFSHFVCGGSLISNRFILTSAGCIRSAQSATIYLGTTDIRKDEPTRIKIEVTSKNFIIHELYEFGVSKNDIALIRLPQNIEFTDAIQPITIAEKDVPLENLVGIFSGYGTVEPPVKEKISLLRFGQQKVVPHNFCEYYYRGQYNKSHHLCVDSLNGIEACNGDAGGPFVVPINEHPQVVGITSFFTGVCGGGVPVVYSRVAVYFDWIITHMKL